MGKKKYCYLKFMTFFIPALTLDGLTKLWAISRLPFATPSLPFASLALSFNRGISFSMLSDGSWGLVLPAAGLSALFLVSIKYGYFRTSIGGALLWAGAAGNLIDRILYGYVVDWLYVGVFINLADIWLCLGGVIALVQLAGKISKKDN